MANNISGGEKLGNAESTGKRTVRITKRDKRITLTLDVTSDGPSDDDFQKVIDDVTTYSPELDPTNARVFFGGMGVFHRATITID